MPAPPSGKTVGKEKYVLPIMSSKNVRQMKELKLMNGPDAPWATQKVIRRRGKDVELVRVELVHGQEERPWASPRELLLHPTDEAFLDQRFPMQAEPHEKAAKEPEPQERRFEPSSSKSARLVCAKNYAAVEASHSWFGMIDTGFVRGGVRGVIVHVPKRHKAWTGVLNEIRQGVVLKVRPTLGKSGHQTHALRVQYTTPSRYYSPGAKISTLEVGVPEADWQGMTTGPKGI
jgi:hypothetical protein